MIGGSDLPRILQNHQHGRHGGGEASQGRSIRNGLQLRPGHAHGHLGLIHDGGSLALCIRCLLGLTDDERRLGELPGRIGWCERDIAHQCADALPLVPMPASHRA